MTEVAEMTREEVKTALEQIAKTTRTLLDLQHTDDPERAFANALKFLIRAADVRDDFKGIHFSIALHVLVAEFGIENVRNSVRQIGRQITRR